MHDVCADYQRTQAPGTGSHHRRPSTYYSGSGARAHHSSSGARARTSSCPGTRACSGER